MPRLSTHRYLQIHHQLKRLWLTNMDQFAELSSRNQYNLHGYFQITNNETDKVLLQNRLQITKRYPSLPHQAGKAFKVLDSIPLPQAQHASVLVKGKRRKPGTPQVISMHSVVRPKPDIHKLAQAFRAFAKEQETKQKLSD